VEPVPAELDAASGVVKDAGTQSVAAGWVSSLRARFKRWVLGDRVCFRCRQRCFLCNIPVNNAVATAFAPTLCRTCTA